LSRARCNLHVHRVEGHSNIDSTRKTASPLVGEAVLLAFRQAQCPELGRGAHGRPQRVSRVARLRDMSASHALSK
jgi:hypothetical protein